MHTSGLPYIWVTEKMNNKKKTQTATLNLICLIEEKELYF